MTHMQVPHSAQCPSDSRACIAPLFCGIIAQHTQTLDIGITLLTCKIRICGLWSGGRTLCKWAFHVLRRFKQGLPSSVLRTYWRSNVNHVHVRRSWWRRAR